MSFFIFVLIFSCAFNSPLAKDTYKAAVLEFHPIKSNNAHEDFSNNVRLFLEFIEQAAYQGVDIIVFPEDGLTGWIFDTKYMPTFATVVPDSESQISPCTDRNGNYTHYLIDFSCACKRHKIYAVINLIEAIHDDRGGTTYRNTNVALNRAGVVIARYRKINLFGEIFHKPGAPAISTFTTDFGVTFGMFICFDIVFQNPAIDILQNNSVTSIAYPTAWLAELPFYTANSIQHGYAKLHGVNFLAAGLNDPKAGMGGSGIYLSDGKVLSAYITGREESKLIIGDVPKIHSRPDLSNTCQHAGIIESSASHSSDVHLFNTRITDMTNYTVHSLDLMNLEISETICAQNSKFCCTFNVTLKRYSPVEPSYSYKLIVYDGVSAVLPTKTLGTRQCALVACSDTNVASCGQRNKELPIGIYFEHISVTGIFDTSDAVYMPSTVTYDLLPTNQYVYCRKVNGKEEEVSMYTTQKLESLLTFGILGRSFKNDDKMPGPVTDKATRSSGRFYLLCVIMLSFFNSI